MHSKRRRPSSTSAKPATAEVQTPSKSAIKEASMQALRECIVIYATAIIDEGGDVEDLIRDMARAARSVHLKKALPRETENHEEPVTKNIPPAPASTHRLAKAGALNDRQKSAGFTHRRAAG